MKIISKLLIFGIPLLVSANVMATCHIDIYLVNNFKASDQYLTNNMLVNYHNDKGEIANCGGVIMERYPLSQVYAAGEGSKQVRTSIKWAHCAQAKTLATNKVTVTDSNGKILCSANVITNCQDTGNVHYGGYTIKSLSTGSCSIIEVTNPGVGKYQGPVKITVNKN